MTRIPKRLLLAGLLLTPGLAGCHNDNNTEAAKEAEAALGVNADGGTTTEKRDVLVIDEKKVVDAKTGKVLKDDKTVTPVTVETKVKESVNADVGDPQPGSATAKPGGK